MNEIQMKWFVVLYVLLISMAIIVIASEPKHMLWNSTSEDEAKSRDKRYLVFPYNSEVALAMAIVIPLGLKHRNTYLSYNMEANFYLQYFDTIQGIVPPPFSTIDEPNLNAGSVIFYASQTEQRKLDDDNVEKVSNLNEEHLNATTSQSDLKAETKNLKETATEFTVKVEHPPFVSFEKTSSTQHNNNSTSNGRKKDKKTDDKNMKKYRINREILSTLMSRKKFYKILKHKMDIAGLNGEKCLLRAICETAEQPYTEHNGVLGDIIHIIFTPTTSRDEKLPLKYYEAIENGKFGQCRRYYKKLCPIGIFDFISTFQ